MYSGLKIRFQHWVLATVTLLVVTLAVVFLLTVFRTFSKISEENAIARFTLIGQQAYGRLDALLSHSASFVTAQAHAEIEQFVLNRRLNPKDQVSPFLASLEADDTMYSHFVGLANDEFLQVIALRENPRIVAALKGPQQSYFAVRRIQRKGEDQRSESWTFLDRQRRVLEVQQRDAQFIPTSRPWYAGATKQNRMYVTEPYLFASTGDLGVTVAHPLPDGAGALGSDISLQSLNEFLTHAPLSANGLIVLQDAAGRILALYGKGDHFGNLRVAPLSMPDKIDDARLAVLREGLLAEEAQILLLGPDRERFVVTQHRSGGVWAGHFRVVVLAPVSDFSGAFVKAERDVVLASIIVLLILLPLAFLGSRQVSHNLVRMAQDSERLKGLDFSAEPTAPDTFLYEIRTLGEAQVVMQHSIKERTGQLERAQHKLSMLVENGLRFAQEQDRTLLLRHILFGAKNIVPCQAATLFLKTDSNTLIFAQRTSDDPLPTTEIPLFDPDTGKPRENYVAPYVALHNRPVVIDDVYSETHFDVSGTKRFSEESGFRTVSMLTVPLSPQEGEVIAVLQLLNACDPNTGEIVPFDQDMVGYVEALAAQAAVALQNHNLMEAQRQMMDALIKIIAGSIDAKSPYTGGHCERVPELALMLAEEACKVEHGPLADFRFASEDEWREFRIGAWLHDCGKVTTPEYVVDKATKLETIYNRIHEIRMRFEVLLRDAAVDRLQAIYQGGMAVAEADAAFAQRQRQLMEDFAFVAECNVGGEFMAPERIERLQQIAGETWLRHFDDRLGLGHEEAIRLEREEVVQLPSVEKLLADKPRHVVPRSPNAALEEKWGWKINIPENLYNFGELYNLSVARGTLSEEERFKINEHIIQTIVMLEKLPLPKNMRRIPEYAGTHHETLIGSGYPRKLTADGLSVPSRIMAIADIFEALTASDRPYKKGKTLSESIKILSFFKKDKHIDPVLFDLFLSSGAYRRYAERYLKPEQIDEVDIAPYLG